MRHLDHHLSEILGRPVRRDHSVARTLGGLLACSVFVTLLVVSVAGQYCARHVADEAARRWARGEFFRADAIEHSAANALASRSGRRPARARDGKV